MADALRKRAASATAPTGQTVSGIYVAPSWTQNLAHLFDQYQAGSVERGAAKAESDLARNAEAARQQWASSLPQAREAVTRQVAEGLGGREKMVTEEVSPAQPLTVGQVLKHTMAGMAIPGNAAAAQLYSKGAMEDISREDKQLEARATLLSQQTAAKEKYQAELEARQRELQSKLEDRALDRASREQMQGLMIANQREIALGNQELRRLQIENNKAAADAKAREAATKQQATTEGEKSAAGYLTRMQESEKIMNEVGKKGDMNILQKAIGGIPLIGAGAQPYVMGAATEKTLQAQRDWVRAKLRKESGATIGDKEMAEEIRTYFPQPGEGKEVIDQKAAARQTAMRQMEIMSGREAANVGMGKGSAAPTVKRTGTDASGRKVEELSDGTVRYAPGS